MQIWVDADACPNVIKEVLFRAAERTGMMVTLVANQIIRTPPSRLSALCALRRASTWPITKSSNALSRGIWLLRLISRWLQK